jgi:hypothetical protein
MTGGAAVGRSLDLTHDAGPVGDVLEPITTSEVGADENAGRPLAVATGGEQADAGAQTNLLAPVTHMRNGRPGAAGVEHDAPRAIAGPEGRPQSSA